MGPLRHSAPSVFFSSIFSLFSLNTQQTAHSSIHATSILLNTYYVPGIVLGAKPTNRQSQPNRQNPASVELTPWTVELPFRHGLSFPCFQLPFPHLAGPSPPAKPSSPFQRYPSWERCHNRAGTSSIAFPTHPDIGCCIASENGAPTLSLV